MLLNYRLDEFTPPPGESKLSEEVKILGARLAERTDKVSNYVIKNCFLLSNMVRVRIISSETPKSILQID